MASSSEPEPAKGLLHLVRGELRSFGRALWWPLVPLLLVFVASVALVYQTPAAYSIDVGSRQDEAYTLNFHARSDTVPSYRWSDVYGYIVLPGIGGSRPFTVTLTVDPGRTAPVEVFINGEQFFSSPLDAGWHTLAFRVDATHPQALQSRDTVIELRSTDYRTEENPAEPKGMKVDTLAIRQDANGPFIVPALAPLAWMCLALVLTYLLVHRIAAAFASQGRARLYGLIASALLAFGSLLVLTESRIFVGAAAGHVATTLFSALLISVAVEVLLRWRGVRSFPGAVQSARLCGRAGVSRAVWWYGPPAVGDRRYAMAHEVAAHPAGGRLAISIFPRRPQQRAPRVGHGTADPQVSPVLFCFLSAWDNTF